MGRFDNEGRTLPKDCPLLEKHNRLRDLIMGLNPELAVHFGPEAKVDVQRVNPDSIEYKEVGLRWFVILPWPQMNETEFIKFKKYLGARIRTLDILIGAESFGLIGPVAGGALAIAIGLREKLQNTTSTP